VAEKPKEVELDDVAERFRAARFVRPFRERPAGGCTRALLAPQERALARAPQTLGTIDIPDLERVLDFYHARLLRFAGGDNGARFFDGGRHGEPAA
jgi:hypothetical protein